jgi:hypothetical protein
MVYGAPINVWKCIALLGSATLVVAAVLALLRLRAAAKAAIAGSLLVWVFYAPTAVISFSTPFSTWRQIRFFISYRDYVPVVGMLLGPILLIACTLISTQFLRHRKESGKVVAR